LLAENENVTFGKTTEATVTRTPLKTAVARNTGQMEKLFVVESQGKQSLC